MHQTRGPDDLLTAREAAAVLSTNAGREIKPDYVRVLVSYKKLTPVPIDGRTNMYRRGEVEKIVVARRPGRKAKDSKTHPSTS